MSTSNLLARLRLKAHVSREAKPRSSPSRPTPADLTISVRDRRFVRHRHPTRWWLNGDPVATAWCHALSVTFPQGEAFFVDAVRAHRDGAPPRLAEEIRDFVRQEINHTREHVAFNRLATQAGYQLDAMEQRVREHLDIRRNRPTIVNLAATIALEHFTAMFANELLSNPRHLQGAQSDAAELWRWHAIEEIEHKGVAYDTWLHATRDWPRSRRWRLKSVMMLLVTRTFLTQRIRDTIELLAQDGLTGARWKARTAWFLLGRPGILRRMLPAWAAYFLPGFHPWNHDDRALIVRHEAAAAGAFPP